MDTHCATFETLLAMVQGRLAGPDVNKVSSHVAQCPGCTAELQSIEDTHLALSALYEAELDAARPRTTWAQVAATAERPPFLLRLPPVFSDAMRTSRTLAQPAIAGTFAAVILGLSLGTWLGFASQRATATAEASTTYSASSLLASPSSGIADSYFESSDTAPATNVLARDSVAPDASGGEAR